MEEPRKWGFFSERFDAKPDIIRHENPSGGVVCEPETQAEQGGNPRQACSTAFLIAPQACCILKSWEIRQSDPFHRHLLGEPGNALRNSLCCFPPFFSTRCFSPSLVRFLGREDPRWDIRTIRNQVGSSKFITRNFWSSKASVSLPSQEVSASASHEHQNSLPLTISKRRKEVLGEETPLRHWEIIFGEMSLDSPQGRGKRRRLVKKDPVV